MSTPPSMGRRRSSNHYQTFASLRPPKGRGRPLSRDNSSHSEHTGTNSNRRRSIGKNSNASGGGVNDDDGEDDEENDDDEHDPTPLPIRQLVVLAIISLCEQTALNSISPYLPQMTESFPEVDSEKVGVSVGLIATAFSVAQFATNWFYGNLSDRIGRKPVILSGTILLAVGFVFFGFSRNLWHAVLGQAIMGAVTGNQGVVSTVLGEITDRSNQSSAFAYLPMIYGVGAVVGPIIGGLLVTDKSDPNTLFGKYPYLLPNLVSAALLVADFVICIFFLDESLAEARKLPPIGRRMKSVFTWMWQFTSSSTRPTYIHENSFSHPNRKNSHERSNLLSTHNESDESERHDEDHHSENDNNEDSPNLIESNVPWREILTTSNMMMLVTYTFFNFSLVAYNSLFPIFVSAQPPTGRGVPPKEIGLSLSFGGITTILYQLGIFSRLQDKFGTLNSFRAALVLFALTFFAMPFVGYSDEIGKKWLWVELGIVLALKVVATVTCLTCAMLMITNCAPSPSTLGTLNGLAQTLSSGGRAFAPFVSGGLFTLGTGLKKGELLPWGVFGGIAMLDFCLSLGISKKVVESNSRGNNTSPDDSDGTAEASAT